MVLGWLWGSSSTDNPSIKNLDPSLQSILDDQKRSQTSSRPVASQETTYTQQLRDSGDLSSHRTQQDDSTSQPESQKPLVPKQSLYQDGRYAHLWKNYEPQHVVESRGETELDKLKRLSDETEGRKVQLGQAALENCVFEQIAELDCLKNGGVTAKLTMCRPEKKAFSSCYEMQCKFLKALGYWDAVGDEERSDAIQMYSDKLWQRLQAQEKAITLAKEEGRPIPDFGSILSPENVTAVGGHLIRPPKLQTSQPHSQSQYEYPAIPETSRPVFDARIKDLSHDEARIEEAVFLAEIEQKRRQFMEASGRLRAEGDARRKRFEVGEATLGDRIKRATNWDAWDSQFPLPADAKARQEGQPGDEANK